MTSEGGRREESVQFSLKELLKLEDERLEEQRKADREREAAKLRAKEAAEAKAREEAEAKTRAAAEASEKKRHAELDDLARREAMQKALMEQARVEVEVRARAEERELERKHELELQKLRATGSKNTLGGLAGAAALGGFVMLVVALGIHFGVDKPRADRQIAELQQSIAGEQSHVKDLDRRLEGSREKIAGLEKDVATLTAENASLKSKLAAAAGAPSTHHVVGARGVPVPPSVPRPNPTVCQQGDPMCFALPGH